MILNIVLNKVLHPNLCEMNRNTFEELKKIKNIILEHGDYFFLGDFKVLIATVQVQNDNRLEDNILYVSTEVKEKFYKNVDRIQIDR